MHLKRRRAPWAQITLHVRRREDGGRMPIRYRHRHRSNPVAGLITAKRSAGKAVLYPEYVGTFARAGTRFSMITPQISAAGVEHLDTLFQAYINVEPPRPGTTRF